MHFRKGIGSFTVSLSCVIAMTKPNKNKQFGNRVLWPLARQQVIIFGLHLILTSQFLATHLGEGIFLS
jgi:hypothetical protein